MANIDVKDATGATKTLKTTTNGGVETPHHNVDALPADPLGANADAAIITDVAGSISGKLRGLVKWAYERMPASLGQGTMAQSMPVVIASNQTDLPVAALKASEAHIGQVGKAIVAITVVPTINPAAYAANDVIGTDAPHAIAGATRIAAGSGVIRSAVLADKTLQSTDIDVLLFGANPASSTFTDNTAIAVHADDIAKLVGILSFATWEQFAANQISQLHDIGLHFKLAAGSTLYAVFVTRGAPTYASVSDLALTLEIEQN